MIQLTRQQIIAVSVLFALVAGCVFATTLAFVARSAASQDLDDAHDRLTHLQAAYRQHDKQGKGRAITDAPETAFLTASTSALAGAQMQTYLARLVTAQHANLTSSGLQAATHEDSADTIRLQVTFDMGLVALQTLLYDLETGTPYIFVDALSVQPPSGTQRAMDDPILHVTLNLRALWRRTTS